MRKGLIAALLWLGMLAGCNSEPVYQGVSFIAYNYTPWNIRSISVKDKGDGVASTMQVSPGGGEGSVTCCFTLKGTEFTVDWRGVDAELLRKHLHDGKADSLYFDRHGAINFPAAEIPAGDGPLYLELHIYPDEHMELALSRKLLGQTRIPIVDTVDWLWRSIAHRLAPTAATPNCCARPRRCCSRHGRNIELKTSKTCASTCCCTSRWHRTSIRMRR